MHSPSNNNFAPTLQPALELIYLATLHPEEASRSLRKLLLGNPDYFQSLPENSFKVVLKITGDTAYEKLGCVSYIPLLDQIYASIEIRQNRGYSFRSGNASSHEYVRFYLSSDNGATWQNSGLTAINVQDDPGAKGRLHLVTKRMGLRRNLQSDHAPVLVRAILSWNSPPPPNEPDWTPLWGHVVETQVESIRLHARRTDRLQTEPWVPIADATETEERVGRSPESADAWPAGAPTSAGLSFESPSAHEQLQSCSV
jgi:hypothetical protein